MPSFFSRPTSKSKLVPRPCPLISLIKGGKECAFTHPVLFHQSADGDTLGPDLVHLDEDPSALWAALTVKNDQKLTPTAAAMVLQFGSYSPNSVSVQWLSSLCQPTADAAFSVVRQCQQSPALPHQGPTRRRSDYILAYVHLPGLTRDSVGYADVVLLG